MSLEQARLGFSHNFPSHSKPISKTKQLPVVVGSYYFSWSTPGLPEGQYKYKFYPMQSKLAQLNSHLQNHQELLYVCGISKCLINCTVIDLKLLEVLALHHCKCTLYCFVLRLFKKKIFKRKFKQNNNFYNKNNNLVEICMLRLADKHLWYVMVKTVSLII